MAKRERKRKTLDLPVDLLDWFESRAGVNQRTLTGQLIVDLDNFKDRETRLAENMAAIELQTR